MDKGIIYIITIFFILGSIDYLLGNRFNIGIKFEEGIKAMGVLGFGMIGFYSLAPILAKTLSNFIVPLANILQLDPAVLPAGFLAIDMGGYQLAETLGKTKEMQLFSGIVISSTLGATVSFTIPIMVGIIPKEEQWIFSKGVIAGLMAVPVGCFVGGIYQGIRFTTLMWNLMPIFIFSILLSIGLFTIQDLLIKVFGYIGKIVMIVSVIGLLLQGINTILGVTVISGLTPIGEVMEVVGKIAFVLGGAYPMLAYINRVCCKLFNKCGKFLGISNEAVGGLVGNLASNLLVFSNYRKMDDKGKIICIAAGISMAFVFGGQLGFVSGVASSMVGPFIVAKMVGGVLSILLACWIYERGKHIDKQR